MKDRGFTDKALATVSVEDWKQYYRDGYTPMEAFKEDMSYAD